MLHRYLLQSVAATALLLASATQAEARSPELAVVIASQGNQALLNIRAELAQLRTRPALPARAAQVALRTPGGAPAPGAASGSSAAARCAE